MDTLLQEPDITQDSDRIIRFAPGVGNKPLGMNFFLFLLFIVANVKLITVEDLCPFTIWELQSKDRRVVQSVPNIFYKLNKLQIRQIQESTDLSLRKCKTKGET